MICPAAQVEVSQIERRRLGAAQPVLEHEQQHNIAELLRAGVRADRRQYLAGLALPERCRPAAAAGNACSLRRQPSLSNLRAGRLRARSAGTARCRRTLLSM